MLPNGDPVCLSAVAITKNVDSDGDVDDCTIHAFVIFDLLKI
jgi:hypothetical protein